MVAVKPTREGWLKRLFDLASLTLPNAHKSMRIICRLAFSCTEVRMVKNQLSHYADGM